MPVPDTEPSSATVTDGGRRGRRWLDTHPLLVAGAVSIAGAAAGFWVAAGQAGDLRNTLQIAATTLLFGTLIGGVVKLLLEDVQRAREHRAEQARFVAAVLADLKAVYDRVERVRVLIPAHRSARTYDEQMRDLIDARVQLRNVIRALDNGSGIRDDDPSDVRLAVKRMERYLAALTGEFQAEYKPIADAQRDYEARVELALAGERSRTRDVQNEAWAALEDLPRLTEFLTEATPRSEEDPPDREASGYRLDFEEPLDLASWLLRAELKRLLGAASPPMPAHHAATRERLQRHARSRHLDSDVARQRRLDEQTTGSSAG